MNLTFGFSQHYRLTSEREKRGLLVRVSILFAKALKANQWARYNHLALVEGKLCSFYCNVSVSFLWPSFTFNRKNGKRTDKSTPLKWGNIDWLESFTQLKKSLIWKVNGRVAFFYLETISWKENKCRIKKKKTFEDSCEVLLLSLTFKYAKIIL